LEDTMISCDGTSR